MPRPKRINLPRRMCDWQSVIGSTVVSLLCPCSTADTAHHLFCSSCPQCIKMMEGSWDEVRRVQAARYPPKNRSQSLAMILAISHVRMHRCTDEASELFRRQTTSIRNTVAVVGYDAIVCSYELFDGHE